MTAAAAAWLMTVICSVILSGVCGDISQPLITSLEEELIETDPHFTNHWAVHILGGSEVADNIARELGYINKGQVGSLEGYYSFVKENHPTRSKRHATDLTHTLLSDKRVIWVEQQDVKKRVKRDFVDKRQEERAYKNTHFDDNYWGEQWYLYDGREGETDSKMDLHVVPCWSMNITGRGIVVSVLDDGLEWSHADLKENYSPDASFDFNEDDEDPFPRYDARNSNKHGTRCAGEIAMVANNKVCGVGVAYNAKIGGIRMLDGVVTDVVESKALSFGLDIIDIFSASWGPNDDGKTVEGPGHMATQAILKGITKGRDGKGVIYVWASGNGGSKKDNCNCDGYVASIYTIPISSASETQHSPWYAEQCASTMATAYSSGNEGEHKIVSADLRGKCTKDHTGTSASAPLAAGIFALALESNPNLTWRDVQHLVAWTSDFQALKDSSGWKMNGAGFMVNNRFGFGLLNAFAMVTAANGQNFQSVPPKNICTIDSKEEQSSGFPIQMRAGHAVLLNLTTTGCKGQVNAINYMEHTQVYLDIEYSTRGDLEIWIMSPSGTNTTLLTRRPSDKSSKGFINWPFLSIQAWGEDPKGTWQLCIVDQSKHSNSGQIKAVSLVLHGTREQPYHMEKAGGRRTYKMGSNDANIIKESTDENMSAE